MSWSKIVWWVKRNEEEEKKKRVINKKTESMGHVKRIKSTSDNVINDGVEAEVTWHGTNVY